MLLRLFCGLLVGCIVGCTPSPEYRVEQQGEKIQLGRADAPAEEKLLDVWPLGESEAVGIAKKMIWYWDMRDPPSAVRYGIALPNVGTMATQSLSAFGIDAGVLVYNQLRFGPIEESQALFNVPVRWADMALSDRRGEKITSPSKYPFPSGVTHLAATFPCAAKRACFAATGEGIVSLRSLETTGQVTERRTIRTTQQTSAGAIAVSPEGSCIVLASLEVLCGPPYERVTTWEGLIEPTKLLWSPGGDWVFGADAQGNAVVWGFFSAQALQARLLWVGSSPVVGVVWLDEEKLATFQSNGTLTVWSIPAGKVISNEVFGMQETYQQARFAPIQNGVAGVLMLADGFSVRRITIKQVE